MNLSLLDPFAVASEYPETLTQTLSFGHSTSVKYNNKGDYLASGLVDGTIVVIDKETNNIIKVLRDHTRSITSLNWSPCGRYILSSSRDWKVNLWDLATGEVIRTTYFEGPIWNCVFLPPSTRNLDGKQQLNDGKVTASDCQHENEQHSFRFVAALFEDEPVFVDFSDEENQKVITLDTDPLVDDNSAEPSQQQQSNGNDESGDIEMTPTQEPSEQQQQPKRKKKKIPKHHTIVVIKSL
ncbi:unnamed protein product [Ambrosiozyma monospora]|uniref:Unnamed protein product n=1 Tax=Ambrosiozyma monospora TaxID=43982 RepID=A0A9W6YTE5_AMBMO|nr:unnamed protein product [Ambrosiozyma monospora]